LLLVVFVEDYNELFLIGFLELFEFFDLICPDFLSFCNELTYHSMRIKSFNIILLPLPLSQTFPLIRKPLQIQLSQLQHFPLFFNFPHLHF